MKLSFPWMKKEPSRIHVWLIIAIVALIGHVTIYIVAQQVLRSGANDPQVQIAQDTAIALNSGIDPTKLLPPASTDISKSLAPFAIIFDDKYQPLASTAILNNTTPIPPTGALQYAAKHNQNRITWQPKRGIRIATVIMHYVSSQTNTSGFVLVGRSLQEVEKNTQHIFSLTIFGWLSTLIVSWVLILLLFKKA